eukprot:gene29186-35223_t
MEDFVLRNKYLVGLQAVGFTINTEHILHANWTFILDKQPAPRVVLYMRTNLAKLAVSAIKGEMMHHMCLKSNLRVSDKSCTIPSQIYVSKQNFTFQLSRWLQRQTKQLIEVDKVFKQRNISVLHVSYEMLQLNRTTTMNRILGFLLSSQQAIAISSNLSNPDPGYTPSIPPLSKLESVWHKRSADDLRQVLSNFREINDILHNMSRTHNNSCSILQEMLGDVVGQQSGLNSSFYLSYDPVDVYSAHNLRKIRDCVQQLSET